MRYVINPVSGWEENFNNKEDAINRAQEIINKDESEIASVHGYKNPETLIDERWESIEEMYEILE